MASRRRILHPDEYLKYLQEVSEGESDVDVDEDDEEEYLPPRRNDASGSSDSSDSDMPEVESAQDSVQPENNTQNVPAAGSSSGRGRGRNQINRVGVGRGQVKRDHQVGLIYMGKDKVTAWTVSSTGSNTVGRVGAHNIMREKTGPSPLAKRYVDENVTSAWRLFVDESMLRHIKKCTEAEASRNGQASWTISLDELDAFLAILYARGAYGCNSMDYDFLWKNTWGPPFFSETMSRNRFRDIMKYLRFDLKSTRSQRLQTDKFAMCSEIWNRFIENCTCYFIPGENLTADEQLFPSKARCRFTQYMPNKPDKFGIKFWMLVDVESKYMCNAFPYLGKDESRLGNESLPESVVMKLSEPYLNAGRNITTDNFFTSLKLANRLKDKNTSLVGTIRKDKKEVPCEIQNSKTQLYETCLLKHADFSLTVYQAKKSKNVLLLSTLHNSVKIDSQSPKKLPETIKFYNETKYGVDIVDQMARKYSVRASSRRWPIHVFYNILDLASINAWVIYKAVTGNDISRHSFLLKLAVELREKHLFQRQRMSLPVAVPPSFPNQSKKRKQCQVALCNENKTSNICSLCSKYVCGTCTSSSDKIFKCKKCTNG